jgi:hypothetical protein
MPVKLANVIAAVHEWRRVILERSDPSKGDPLPQWYVEMELGFSPRRDTISPPHWMGLLNGCQFRIRLMLDEAGSEWADCTDEQVIALADLHDLTRNFGLTPQIVSERAAALRLVKELDTFLEAMQLGGSSPRNGHATAVGVVKFNDEAHLVWDNLQPPARAVARFLLTHGAFDRDHSWTREAIYDATKAELPSITNPDSLSIHLTQLKESGVTTAERGHNGGTWLTKIGRPLVEWAGSENQPRS